MTDPYIRFGAAMVRLRWVVLAAWLVLLGLAGGLLTPRANGIVRSGGFDVAGSDSLAAAEVLTTEFNSASKNNAVVVFRASDRTVDDETFRRAVDDAATRTKGVEGVRAVNTFYTTGDPGLVSADRRTTMMLIALAGDEQAVQEVVPDLRERLEDVQLEHYVTGAPGLNYDVFKTSEDDLRRSELFTVPIILILLLLVFRTLVAATIPLVLGGVVVVLTMAIIAAFGLFVDTSIFALNVASMIGLGLAIDFSLLMVSRCREERAAGWATPDAVARTMASAGRAITYSAVTVMLAMAVTTLLLGHLMIVRSISMAVMIVAAAALAAGLTLLPALLALFGGGIERLRVMPRPRPRVPGAQGGWYRFSHAVMRRPWAWLGAGLLLLAVIAFPARELSLVGVSPGLLPREAESVVGIRALSAAFGANTLSPIQVVARTAPGGIWRPDFLEGLRQLTDAAAADPRNQGVQSLITVARGAGLTPEQIRTLTPEVIRADPRLAAAAAQFVNLNGASDAAVVTITSRYDQYDGRHQQYVYDLREVIIPAIPPLRAAESDVGGGAADFLDFRDTLYGRFPLVAVIVMAIIFVILMMFFQSIFLPLKAILLNIISIAATYGVLVVIFQWGWGERLLGFESQGKINQLTPPILFVILFALSTDYEVFLLSRVKEYYHQLRDNEEAVAVGLEQTAGLITAAGLILIGTFGSFVTGQLVTIKEIGLGLAAGVLIDATIVRVILVPATMRLAGATNWWLPPGLKRILPELREGPAPAPPVAPMAVPPPPLAHAGAVSGMSDVVAAGASPANGWAAMPASPVLAAPPPFVVPPAAPPPPVPPPTDPPFAAPVPAAPPADTAPTGYGSQQANHDYLSTAQTLPNIGGWLRPSGEQPSASPIALPLNRAFRIGRQQQVDLRLADASVSRLHAQIEFDLRAGSFVITDNQSTNGVFVNGQRIAEPTLLRDGDRLEIGTDGANFTLILAG